MIRCENGIFRLTTDTTSYWFQTNERRHLEHLYYGPRLADDEPVEGLRLKHSALTGSTVAYDPADQSYSLDTTALEWSGMGYGDYRYSPSDLKMPDGSFSTDFRYVSHTISAGTIPAASLPTAYADAVDQPAQAGGSTDRCQSLSITLEDEATHVSLTLLYTVFPEVDVITRRAVLTNGLKPETLGTRRTLEGRLLGPQDQPTRPLTIRRLMSGLVDLPNRGFSLVTFDGAWIKEAHRHDRQLQPGMYTNFSTTGGSSNRHNPGFLLAEQGAGEDSGWVYGFNLVYSGNHFGGVELDSFGLVRVVAGINPDGFEWQLEPGQSFETPEMVLTFSPDGFNGLSHHFHDFIGQHIVRGEWREKERPVLLNNWEATFFTFTQRELLGLAKQGKKLGVELFVLDDGWFGARDSDHAGLGDYWVNRKKLPSGLDGLARKIEGLGLKFGLWFEPEMVNPDSDLYRAHPDWAVSIPGRRDLLGRNQLVLDLSRAEVQDYIISSVGQVLDSAAISYVKWDMNRHISAAYSPGLTGRDAQGEFSHRYILGLYRVLREIFGPRPHILLESCSSGGNRFDLGMLCFSPQIWVSDDTDPIERLDIQGGLSYLYPPSTWGAHVSATPHQQTLRVTPLATRFNVAAFGDLGYELDLRQLSRLEKQEVKQQIAFYKRHRRTFQFGQFSRVPVPKSNKVVWQVVCPDQTQAVSGFFQTQAQAAESGDRLPVTGLAAGRRYRLQTRPQPLYLSRFGDLLKHVLPVALKGDGLILRTLGKFYQLDDAVEAYEGSADLLGAGVLLNNQFMGTGYNKQTRLLGDFGSNLYTVEALSEPVDPADQVAAAPAKTAATATAERPSSA